MVCYSLSFCAKGVKAYNFKAKIASMSNLSDRRKPNKCNPGISTFQDIEAFPFLSSFFSGFQQLCAIFC